MKKISYFLAGALLVYSFIQGAASSSHDTFKIVPAFALSTDSPLPGHFEINDLLHRGIMTQSDSIVSEAIKMGADVNKPMGIYQEHPLIIAIFALQSTNFQSPSKATAIIQTLLRSGAKEIHLIRDRLGAPIVHTLLRNMFLNKFDITVQNDITSTIIEKMTPFELDAAFDDKTPLELSIVMSNHHATQEIIQRTTQLHRRNKLGQTPLMLASKNNNQLILRELIRAGALVNVEDKDGKTPLMYAIKESMSPLNVVVLLQAGADVNSKDHLGKTPLIHATDCNWVNIKTIQALLCVGARINETDHLGDTAIMKLLKKSFKLETPSRVNLLISSGATVLTINKKGQRLLELATNIKAKSKEAQNQKKELIKTILERELEESLQSSFIHSYSYSSEEFQSIPLFQRRA